MEKIAVIIGWDKNYNACCNVAPGCVATANTLEGIKKEFASALEFHLKGMRADDDEIPMELQGDYELDFQLNSRALVHYAESLVSRPALAEYSGINVRQLGHYATGKSEPRTQQIIRIKKGLKEICTQLSTL